MSCSSGSNAMNTIDMLSRVLDLAEACSTSSAANPMISCMVFDLSGKSLVITAQIISWTSCVDSLSKIPSEQLSA